MPPKKQRSKTQEEPPAASQPIIDWVAARDPEFAAAIRDLGVSLSAGRGGAGVTFLSPASPDYRARVATADPDEAARLVEALVIPDAFAKASEFKSRPAGNRLGVLFMVKSAASQNRVAFEGFTAALANGFPPRDDAAIWVVTDGEVPAEGPEYTPPRAAKRNKKKAQEAATTSDAGRRFRSALAADVSSAHIEVMARDRDATFNPYLAAVVSVLNHASVTCPEVARAVAPLLDYDPIVTFYLIFEPHRRAGAKDYVLPDALLLDWGGKDLFSDAVEEYLGYFAAPPRARVSVVDVVDGVRQRIESRPVHKRAEDITAAYEALATRNTIDGLEEALPEATHVLVAGARKQWQDEFRHVFHAALDEVASEPRWDPMAFREALQVASDNYPGDDPAGELVLMAPQTSNVNPRSERVMLGRFLRSTDFLYVAVPPEEVGDPSPAFWGRRPDEDGAFFDRNAVALAALRRCAMVRPGLSRSTMNELKFAAARGRLPDGLLGSLAKGEGHKNGKPSSDQH
jgi:hypothetical protein